jgi:hypothetical protein
MSFWRFGKVALQVMEEKSVQIELRYSGPLVDDGTMSVDDTVKALQGFAGAYGHAVDSLLTGTTHTLKVSSIETGSFRLMINAALQNQAVSDGLKATGGATAKWVFDKIKEAIQAKKRLKGDPVATDIRDNKIVLMAKDGGTINITPEALQLLETKVIDGDLKKITDPLSDGFVDNLILSATDEVSRDEERIDSAEKPFFSGESSIEEKREISLVGTLVSTSKESLRGTFRLQNGGKVPYHYVGQDTTSLLLDFAYTGPLRVEAIGRFDDSAVLKSLDIIGVERLQASLPGL